MKRLHTLLTLLYLLLVSPLASLHAQTLTPNVTIDQLHYEALAYHKLDTNLNPWSRRARWSNALPDLELSATYQDRHDESFGYHEDQNFGDLAPATRDEVRNEVDEGTSLRLTYGVKLRFDLGGAVFDQRELGAAREARMMAAQRRAILSHVTRAWSARAEHIEALRHPATLDDEQRARHKRGIAKAEAELDGLTGGWFSRHTRTRPTQEKP